MAEQRKVATPVVAREAELRNAADRPQAEVTTTKDDKEWDGQGSRLEAVRTGKVSLEAVQGGLTTVPFAQNDLVNEEDSTGRYIAVTPVGKPKGTDKEPVKLTAPGDPVEGLSDEELRPLLVSGAVRRETKEEAEARKEDSK